MSIGDILVCMFLTICFGVLLFCIYALIKNEITCKNQAIIANAICDYYYHMITTDPEYKYDANDSLYDYMEDYDKTFNRFWDWGYTHILPYDKFELIKPYIKGGKKK